MQMSINAIDQILQIYLKFSYDYVLPNCIVE